MDVIIVSGRSGSGKSSAIHALEDLGYYCVDNLPVCLIPQLIQEIQTAQNESIPTLAVGLDARSLRVSSNTFEEMLTALNAMQSINVSIFYCDADNDTLIQRFSETRRKHPMSSDSVSLTEALELERKILSPLVTDSTSVIDTSRMTLHQLRDEMARLVNVTNESMVLLIQSFGFKYGIPNNSDLIFDVRCLQNPHWVPNLRPLNGLDKPVQAFLSVDPLVQKMTQDILNFVHHWIPHYSINNRRYFTLSIGCTGGQHRSVYMAETLSQLIQTDCDVQIRHRQIIKDIQP